MSERAQPEVDQIAWLAGALFRGTTSRLRPDFAARRYALLRQLAESTAMVIARESNGLETERDKAALEAVRKNLDAAGAASANQAMQETVLDVARTLALVAQLF